MIDDKLLKEAVKEVNDLADLKVINMKWIHENFTSNIFAGNLKSIKIGALEMLLALERKNIVNLSSDVKFEYESLTKVN
jgi:hypothetical protein